AAADVEAAVALEIDGAAVGERGAAVEVAVVADGVVTRLEVRRRLCGYIDVAVEGDGGGVGDGEQTAAADGAAGPRLRCAGQADQIGRASCRERVWISGGAEGGEEVESQREGGSGGVDDGGDYAGGDREC